MTAAAISSRSVSNGLRAVNPRRDMSALAELIDVGFSENLDAAGLDMVTTMRRLGRLGWLGWLVARLTLPPAAYPQGFVWESDGRVVGNASLMPVVGYPKRWVMANVVVLPEYRGRGIGADLVRASIDLVRKQRGEKIILQVDEGNAVAQKLYAGLGFKPLTTRNTWLRGAGGPASRSIQFEAVRKRSPDQWRAQWELALKIHPEGLIWPYPPLRMIFQSRRWLSPPGVRSGDHWVWVRDNEILGSLTARWNIERNRWRLIIFTSPDIRNPAEQELLMTGLADLAKYRDGYILETVAGETEEMVRGMGFRLQRTLTWLGLNLNSPSGV